MRDIRVVFTNPDYVKVGLKYEVYRSKVSRGQDICLQGRCIGINEGIPTLQIVKMFNVEPRYFECEVKPECSPVFIWRWYDFVQAEWDIPCYAVEMYRWGFFAWQELKEKVLEIRQLWRAWHCGVGSIHEREYLDEIAKWGAHLAEGTYEAPEHCESVVGTEALLAELDSVLKEGKA